MENKEEYQNGFTLQTGGESGDGESDEYSEEDEQESNYNNAVVAPSLYVKRKENPVLPDTVKVLTTDEGGKVYLVGTAHFSEQSQEDVSQTIKETQPDVVLVELCNSRVNILKYDEDTLLEEAKNINLGKLRAAIKQGGVVQGVMHLLLLSMSAHLTKELGMAPGGEFRRAFQEAQKLRGCSVKLGDRPIQVTLRRALGSLSVWQKARLMWYLLTNKEPITKEEVEKCKQKDLLEEMLREMTGEFPDLSRVFITERDQFLAYTLRRVAHPIPTRTNRLGYVPSVVVGVVGIGHVQGIVDHWQKEVDIDELLRIPEPSLSSKMVKWSTRAAVLSAFAWGCYRISRRLL